MAIEESIGEAFGARCDLGARTSTVREAVLDVCRRAGMTTVFGNPGSTELRMFRDFPVDFEYVLGLQESTVLGMAAGYATATSRAALVSLHSAAGVGHALGNIYNAYQDRVPLVMIAGQQNRGLLAQHPILLSVDAPQLPRPYVKWSHEPERAQDVPEAVAEAHRIAMTPPRGPVLLSVPEDDWDRPANPYARRDVVSDFTATAASLGVVARALAASSRPALVVGPGVDQDGAGAAVVQLAERVGADVWVSPMSCRCSFPEEHPRFAGFLPPVRELLVPLLDPYDVAVVLGAPVFTFHVPSNDLWFERTTLFHIDCDAATVARAFQGTSLLSTVGAAVDGLLELVEDSDRPPTARPPRPEPPATEDPIGPALLMHLLRGVLPDDAVIVEEAVTHRDEIHDFLPVRYAGGYVTTGGGGLGWGMPVAVGMGLAARARRVVCVVGDGAAMYSPQALWTAVQHDVPLTVVVCNNGCYAAMKVLGALIGVPDPPGADLPGIDFVSLARSMGCPSARVVEADRLEAALHAAVTHDGPFLLDVGLALDDEALY